MRRRLVVFAGPSLPEAECLVSPFVTYAAPAKRDDVAKAAADFEAILLVDGVFDLSLAVSTKEVFAALRTTSFIGAASMGALRAVENAPYGALPMGAVARWYSSETIDGDDEVALIFDERTKRAITVPMVNVRYFAWLCRRRGLLDAGQADRLTQRARSIFYAERSWFDILEMVDARVREHARALIPMSDLKRIDAICALRATLRLLGLRAAVDVARPYAHEEQVEA